MKPTLRVAAGVVLLFATQAIAQANPRLNSTAITKILAKTPSCAIFYVMQMFYIFILVSAKASICCFYTRVFTTNNKRFRLATRSFMLFLLSHGLMFTFLVAFQCLPVPAIWDRSIEGRCLSINAIGFTGSACNILEDVILFIMPIPELMKLQLSMRKKLALVFMFSVASFACIASMIRLKYMVSYANTYDATWDNVDVVIWSSIEINLTVMCGSLPALRPLFKKIPGFISTPRLTEDALRRHNEKPKKDANDVKRAQEGPAVVLRELRQLGVDLGDDLAHKITPVRQGMAPMERFIEELDGYASSARAAWVTLEHSAGSRGATKAFSNKSG
ncbi:integral membrane protein [Colletotrichum karsti]|uniref:Integral membrane protein n=1 Tax=Colletotrichum karsti TaxID=1095194 RepID=A0A9P6LPU9_9PEZI|nr:uncharacterized protein CkaCkLH20_01888 [Colletotrichum karsti]KAF9880846.1 integral membrane protein [Colletotrichum karsti]